MTAVRTLSLLALTAALLAGCGGGGSEPDNAIPGEPAPGGNTAPSAPGANDPTSSSSSSSSSGSSAKSSSTGAPNSSTPASTAPKPGKNKEAAKVDALATSGLLVAADLPGFTGSPLVFGDTEDFNVAALYQCLQAPRPVFVGRNPGTSWVKGTARVDSSADVFDSAAAAKKDLAASKSPLAPSCYQEALLRLVERPGTATQSSADSATAKVKGADGAFAIKFSVKATGGGQTNSLDGYLLGVVVDSVRFTVINAATDGAAPALTEAVALAEKAAGRMRALRS